MNSPVEGTALFCSSAVEGTAVQISACSSWLDLNQAEGFLLLFVCLFLRFIFINFNVV